MTKSVDPDETARYEPSHLDLHYLHRYLFVSRAVRVKGIFIQFEDLLPFTCFPAHQAPTEEKSSLKGKNLLSRGANSLLLEQIPIHKGSKTRLTQLTLVLLNKLRCHTHF